MSVLRRRDVRIAVDTALLAAFVTAFLTREPSFDPDYLLHSLVGLAVVPIVWLHLRGNWGWVKRVARRRRHDREARLGAFNTVFGGLTTVCIVSGIPLWVGEFDSSALVGLHAITGGLAILAMIVHLVWNQRRLRALFRRPSRPAPTARPAAAPGTDRRPDHDPSSVPSLR
ncbi:MAG: hypothetical protein ACK5RL_05940 [Acidimicrobiales bacterium]